MKKLIFIALSLALMNTVYAADSAKLSVKISTPTSKNSYFVCLYGIGCLNATSGSRGKSFGISPFDMGNITKVVITDSRTMRMYTQPSVDSCNVNVKPNEELTITGNIRVKNATPYINNLHCSIKLKA